MQPRENTEKQRNMTIPNLTNYVSAIPTFPNFGPAMPRYPEMHPAFSSPGAAALHTSESKNIVNTRRSILTLRATTSSGYMFCWPVPCEILTVNPRGFQVFLTERSPHEAHKARASGATPDVPVSSRCQLRPRTSGVWLPPP